MKFQTVILLSSAFILLSGCVLQKPRPNLQAQRIYREAVKHYRIGIDSYVNSRYAEAIHQWRLTLKLDPKFPNAHEYILRAEKASRELRTLRIVEARSDTKTSSTTGN